MMYADVDVFISNYTLVDPEIYELWIAGRSSSEAVFVLEKRGVVKLTGAPLDLVASDVLDHYRTFSLLERLLMVPTKLSEQFSFQLDHQTKQLLIEKYYSLDDTVAREVLGKKLSWRQRREVEEAAERCGVPARAARRQTHNLKRVYKAVEDLPGSLEANIKQHFLLSPSLAMKYAAVVFIGCMRFETAKKKLQYLTFGDFFHCAQVLKSNWTYCYTGPEFYDTEMDREFLLDLRELRVLLDKEKEHKHLVCMRLKPKVLEKTYQELELNFRSYTRGLMGVACNLHRARELRSYFIDLVEKCVEPLKAGGWSKPEVTHFLSAYEQCALQMDVLRDQELKTAFERYMKVTTGCLLKMYHST